MKNIYILLIFIPFSFLFIGCASKQESLYVYGNYSESYYAAKKDLSADAALSLQKSIEYAIEHKDESLSGRVAPGMYANLGYIYLKSGNPSKAIENFKKEKSIYPEAAHFMDRMIKKVEIAQGKSDE
jgi:hypothetical protein